MYQIKFQDTKSSRCRPRTLAGSTPPSKPLLKNFSFTYSHILLFTYSHRFEKCEDMVNLTYLNDASVFWNLKTRYQAKMIHTYSGMFTYSVILVYSL